MRDPVESTNGELLMWLELHRTTVSVGRLAYPAKLHVIGRVSAVPLGFDTIAVAVVVKHPPDGSEQSGALAYAIHESATIRSMHMPASLNQPPTV
jgi:hypothetical protein